MSSGSPTAYLLWAILAVLFQIFLVVHLWCYDRFKCVLWNSGRQPGAFKRVMTYSYLGTIPALVFFGVAMTQLKFAEGYVLYGDEIIPRPYEMWRPQHRHWVLPLFFVFSGAWAFELVTHLEELTFWLFLLHQGPSRRDWFTSGEYRLWYTGSVVSVIGMPLTTLVTRRDLEMCQIWIFLVGSSASTATTLMFLYVLYMFPGFLRYVKAEGAEVEVVVRLATFYQLNLIRVCFRFLFTLPLLILAIDGVQGRHPILANAFGTDFLLMLGAIGCFVSSAITLLIFFPRSLVKETDYLPERPPTIIATSPKAPAAPVYESAAPSTTGSFFPFPQPAPYSPGSEIMLDAHAHVHHSASANGNAYPQTVSVYRPRTRGGDKDGGVGVEVHSLDGAIQEEAAVSPPPPSYRRHSSTVLAVVRAGAVGVAEERERERELAGSQSQSNLHPYVTAFTSPIDLPDTEAPDDGLPRAI
ncbi:hypothetical protein GLOTRDRAFT_138960 [Gloeophyllum trabeum ATCC 11539]|uniref:Uncharacterized protein n=1 Tax=Gloeophyllum trabeum (strain ATCC 11539 / FP-39264 / Madison 617) TaxID=670483 RepID=S7Q7H5_GLOTA|nr:uncharacterized protein GLOTRDRAFT_138960 [Gloeophyllum trabeum ATCC 11539]EPQ55408.1 hypothetical protein GLOTRDRAFT_138960 [Gloeophyllum trabeum ATCC 11539]